MPINEFIAMLTPVDILWIIGLQILFFFLLYRTIRSRQDSIVDPFTIPIFFVASACSTVVFLYMSGLCSTRLFVTFVSTIAGFLIGYRWVAPNLLIERSLYDTTIRESSLDRKNFLALGIIVVLTLLINISISILMFGLGIEYENRLEIYIDSGGLGILKRINDALMPVAIFFLTYLITQSKGLKRTAACCTFIFFTGYSILDGSKSGFVSIFVILVASLRWMHLNVNINTQPISRKVAAITLLVVISIALLVLTFSLDAFEDFDKFLSGVDLLFFRIVLSADIYVVGFPNDAIDQIIQAASPLLVLFQDLLSTLRLASLNYIPIGTQLYNYQLFGSEINAGGPNAHLGIYTYYLFGEFISPIICLAIGMLIGKVRKIYSERSLKLVDGACITALLVNTSYVMVDPSFMMHRLTNLLIFLLPLYFIFTSRHLIKR